MQQQTLIGQLKDEILRLKHQKTKPQISKSKSKTITNKSELLLVLDRFELLLII